MREYIYVYIYMVHIRKYYIYIIIYIYICIYTYVYIYIYASMVVTTNVNHVSNEGRMPRSTWPAAAVLSSRRTQGTWLPKS